MLDKGSVFQGASLLVQMHPGLKHSEDEDQEQDPPPSPLQLETQQQAAGQNKALENKLVSIIGEGNIKPGT